MTRVLKYVIYDVLRSRLVIVYTLLLFVLTNGLFYLGADAGSSLVSLLHLTLLIVPLVSIIFSTIHYYNSREFIELLLAQPLRRKLIFLGEYLGVSLSLSMATIIGMGIPLLLNGAGVAGHYLFLVSLFLTLIFSAIAFLTSILNSDKARGMGVALILWFYFAVGYDGLVLWLLHFFNDYPLEQAVLVMTTLNPIDLGRVLVLLKLETSALMGYTGALYQKIFGSSLGTLLSLLFLVIWLVIPVWIALKRFEKKDL